MTCQLLDRRQDLLAGEQIQSRSRFIQDQQFWPHNQCSRDQAADALAAAEGSVRL